MVNYSQLALPFVELLRAPEQVVCGLQGFVYPSCSDTLLCPSQPLQQHQATKLVAGGGRLPLVQEWDRAQVGGPTVCKGWSLDFAHTKKQGCQGRAGQALARRGGWLLPFDPALSLQSFGCNSARGCSSCPFVQPVLRVTCSWCLQLLACIGEQFTEGDDICGLVVNLRGKNDRISLWTKSAANEQVQVFQSLGVPLSLAKCPCSVACLFDPLLDHQPPGMPLLSHT